MSNEHAALGGMFEQLVDLGVIEFWPEPLDAEWSAKAQLNLRISVAFMRLLLVQRYERQL